MSRSRPLRTAWETAAACSAAVPRSTAVVPAGPSRAEQSSRSESSDRGAGTILALALALVAIAGCSGAVLVSQGAIAGERAARAADLAALAAADAERGLGRGGTCASAEDVALLNSARVVSCEIEAPGAIVRVVVRGEDAVAGLRAEGRARAGQPP